MPPPSLLHHLLTLLLHRLEAEGQRFGVDVHLRLHQLLRQLPANYPPERLQYLLAPLLAKSPEAQQAFYDSFAQALDEARNLYDSPNNLRPAAELQAARQEERRWRWVGLGLAAVLLLGLAAWCWLTRQAQAEADAVFNQTVALYDGQPSLLRGDTLLPGANRAMFLDNGRTDSLHTSRVVYQLTDSLQLLLTPLDTAGTDSITLLLHNPRGDSLRWTVKSVLLSTPNTPQTPGELFSPITDLPYPHDVFSLAVTPPTPTQQFLHTYLPWIKTLLLLLAAALLAALLVWRDRRRRKLVAELEQRTQPPYVWDIKFAQPADIDLGESLGRVLNQLRQRTPTEGRELDIPATVQATVDGGGMVAFRYRQRTRPPEYLLLIDEQHRHNHRARLFDLLYARFLAEEVIISRYFYHGDLRLCFNEEYPHGIHLQDLASKHPHTRLLIVGSGQGLLSPLNGRLAAWSRLLTRWKERALLSPVPTAEWRLRESQLAELLPVLPASLASLGFLIDQLDAKDEGELDRWAQALGATPTPALQLHEQGLLATLQTHYEPPLLHWIAACAVYPRLQFELTCQLGQLLSTPNRQLLTLENLNHLNQLPWFVAGQMPPAVRMLLLDFLEREQPALLLQVRQFLYASLAASQPPAESAAASDHRLQMALNEWLFTSDARRKALLEKDIAQQLRAGAEADFTVVKFLEGQPSLIDLIVPDSLKRYFSYSDYPALDWRELRRDLRWALPLWLALLVATLWYTPPALPDDCAGELVAYQGQDLCIATDADRLLLWRVLAADAVQTQDTSAVDSLQALTNALTPAGDSAFYLNTAIHYYNYAVAALPQAASDTLLPTVCRNLTRAADLYRQLMHTDELRYLAALQQYCPDGKAATPTTFTMSGRVLDADTGNPIPSATVRITAGAGLRPAAEATTDAQGRYILTDIPLTPQLQLYAAANSYEPSRLRTAPTDVYPDIRLQYWSTTSRLEALKEGADYLNAIATNTVAAYDTYLDKWPNAANAADVRQRRTALLPAATPPAAATIATIAANMQLVPGGTFTMGCQDGRDTDCYDDEKPAHAVTVSTFYISKYEVTQAQWRAVMDSDPLELNNKGCDLCPVEGVSWDDIQDFLTRLNAQTGQNYRLPTEAEWEYAARGGNVSRGYQYSGSNNPDEVAWYSSNSREGNTHGAKKTTRPVGGKKANELGLYDMSGNVWEWCADDWHSNYVDAPADGRAWVDSPRGSDRVGRGGGWFSLPQNCRAADRSHWNPTLRGNNLGFRLARS